MSKRLFVVEIDGLPAVVRRANTFSAAVRLVIETAWPDREVLEWKREEMAGRNGSYVFSCSLAGYPGETMKITGRVSPHSRTGSRLSPFYA